MALPKLEINVVSPTKVSIEVGKKVVGHITIELQEQTTIEGIDNAIIVTGDCENTQDKTHYGFFFSLVKGLKDPKPAVTEPKGE